MNVNGFAAEATGTLAQAPGIVLRQTELAEVHVLWLLVALAIACWALVRARASNRGITRAFAVVAGGYFLGVIVLGLVSFRTLQELSLENGIIEWLTAHCLLIGCVMAAFLAVRQGLRREPCPSAAALAVVLFWAWGRELAWGLAFLGRRLGYSRNLFRWRAYAGVGYFEKFRKSEGLVPDAASLYAAHWVFAGLVFGTLAVLAVYVLRHRRRFVRELRELIGTINGRYFLVGVVGYGSAQVLGEMFEWISKSEAARQWHVAQGVLGHRVVDEPIELWAAACLLMSAVMLIRSFRRPPPEPAACGE